VKYPALKGRVSAGGRMKIYRPSELQAFLKERGIHAKRGLSQNFLIDGNIVQKIADAASISKGDLILEIGPGPGVLTQALLERGASVTAVEMDISFANALQRLQTRDHRLAVICEDILKFPLLDFLRKHSGRFKVVANLPYHITTPILILLLPLHRWIESLTLMVQKEFAERMGAERGTPEYSSFTIFLQFYAEVVKSFIVSPRCFYPRPKVHSSVVHCKLHAPRLETDTDVDAFFRLTRTAFGKRRKMLRASLKGLYEADKIELALAKIGHPVTARPEELSIDEFISFYDFLSAFS
jgi:16S rRNA (adenine1518-N6/adenine1519-N6)-dimethyltransferase